MKAILEFNVPGSGWCADCRLEGRSAEFDTICLVTFRETPEDGRRDDCPLRFEE